MEREAWPTDTAPIDGLSRYPEKEMASAEREKEIIVNERYTELLWTKGYVLKGRHFARGLISMPCLRPSGVPRKHSRRKKGSFTFEAI